MFETVSVPSVVREHLSLRKVRLNNYGSVNVSKNVVRCIYDQLLSYSQLHQAIFRDEAAMGAFTGSFSKYHGLLRSQIAQPLQKFCPSDFAADFIAEALLTWTMAGKDFDEIYSLIEKLFKE